MGSSSDEARRYFKPIGDVLMIVRVLLLRLPSVIHIGRYDFKVLYSFLRSVNLSCLEYGLWIRLESKIRLEVVSLQPLLLEEEARTFILIDFVRALVIKHNSIKN